MDSYDFSFSIKNKAGQEIICDVLSVIQDDDEQKSYVVYTDYLLDSEDKFNLYVQEVIFSDDSYILMDVDEDEISHLGDKLTVIRQHIDLGSFDNK